LPAVVVFFPLYFFTSFLTFFFAEKPDGFDPENSWRSSGYATHKKGLQKSWMIQAILGAEIR